MRIETLRSRIENAKAKIEKKQNTITKKTALIEKKYNSIRKLGVAEPEKIDDMYEFRDNNEVFSLLYDIKYLNQDIDRGNSEIEEIKKSLAKYEAQLAGEIEKEEIFLKEIPETITGLKDELVERWDKWDFERRERLKKEYKEKGRNWFFREAGRTRSDYEFIYKTNEQIHNSNVQDAKILILDLYNRVKSITGEITDWSNIRVLVHSI